MTGKSWLVSLLLALVVVGTSAFLLNLRGGIEWVGRTDLDIVFEVTDASTGLPVNGAIVQVDGDQDYRCKLVTDEKGRASKLLKDEFCSGYYVRSKLTRRVIKDTFHVLLPDWFLQVSAPGYERSPGVLVNTTENQRRVQRGDGTSSLRILIELHPDHAM
jgi:hypothetical protein